MGTRDCLRRSLGLRGAVFGASARAKLFEVMKLHAIPGIGLFFAVVILSQAQQKPGPVISTGVPPRVAPSDYQAQGQAGAVTIAADFVGHSVPTPEATFTTEDYIVVETALFGKAGDHLTLAPDQFSLRINGKKSALPSLPFDVVLRSLKDPEWEEAQAAQKVEKSKTSINGSGGGAGSQDPKPSPPKMPIELAHPMQQKVQKAALPEGDRPLPQAGLIFFQYGGRLKNLHSIELIYNGPAGQAQLNLQP